MKKAKEQLHLTKKEMPRIIYKASSEIESIDLLFILQKPKEKTVTSIKISLRIDFLSP